MVTASLINERSVQQIQHVFSSARNRLAVLMKDFVRGSIHGQQTHGLGLAEYQVILNWPDRE